tara:strand:- start:244 stop:483 length:240 start_codon:yes stop_codon:yes gene_type:complete
MNEKFIKILSEVFSIPLEEINPSLSQKDIDNWDSLKQMDLILSLEKEYNITLGITDIQKMISVKGIITVLKDKGIKVED